MKKFSVTPKYKQLEKHILDMIHSDKFKPGDKIPSERDLAKTYNLSVLTVNKTISELVNKNMLYREYGKGTFVSHLKTNIKKMKHIGIVFDVPQAHLKGKISRKNYSLILEGITNITLKNRYNLTVFGEEYGDMNLSGLILLGGHDVKHDKFAKILHKNNIPYILKDRYQPMENINYVEQYSADEIYRAAQYLIGLGHRRIAGIGFKSNLLMYQNFYSGFRRALEEKDIYDPLLIGKLSKNTEENTSEVVRNLYSLKNPPTAIFLFWAPATENIVSAIEKHGINIPKDVSLIAIGPEQFTKGDLRITTFGGITPVIVGEKAAQHLIDLIEGKIKAPVNIRLKLKLFEGNTCRRRKL